MAEKMSRWKKAEKTKNEIPIIPVVLDAGGESRTVTPSGWAVWAEGVAVQYISISSHGKTKEIIEITPDGKIRRGKA